VSGKIPTLDGRHTGLSGTVLNHRPNEPPWRLRKGSCNQNSPHFSRRVHGLLAERCTDLFPSSWSWPQRKNSWE
jgi:hypothetical protein